MESRLPGPQSTFATTGLECLPCSLWLYMGRESNLISIKGKIVVDIF